MKRNAFTLVELLAVIVILSVIALITTPIVLSQIEQAKKGGFVTSAKNVLDAADIYVSNDNKLDPNGSDVKILEIKNKEKVTGLVFQNKDAEYVLKDFTDGNYCASGPRNDLIVRKGDCTGETDLYASLSLSVKEKTTRKITVIATASDDTGISGYSYCVADCDNDSNWKNSSKNEYTFDSLRYSKKYEIHVRVINRIDKVTEKMIEAVTDALPTATYSVRESGWTKSKTVTITYPNNVENYLIIHSGIAKLNGEVLPVGERRKISGTSAEVIFETNGTIEAITSDGYNEASPSTLTISQVDPTSPTSVSVGIGTVTSKSIQVIANGVDNESGIAKYEFQVNNGSWIDNGTNNTYLFSNLTSGNYTYKVRLTNKAGGVMESSERVQATTTIVTPSYGVSPSGWAKSKTATITYQSGYTNQFRVLSGSATYNGTAVTNNTWITISGTSAGIVFNSNGTIEARSTDGINTVTSSALTISQIDTTAPVVNSLNITSTNGSYNALITTITSNVTDNSGASMQMYISNTGYETGGSWEAYTTSKSWNVGGSLNGGTRTVYITYMDQAGNKINRTLSYAVYAECSSNTNTSYGGWGACSKTCGGGVQYRSVTVTDNKTGRTCSSSTGSQACNTQSCEPTTTTLSNIGSYNAIVPLNSTTAVAIKRGDDGDMSANGRRHYGSFVDATILKYTNGTITVGNTQRILTGTVGSGYGSYTKAVRLSDNRFLIMGNSGETYSSSGNISYYDITASIVELNGTSFSVKTSTYCPTSQSYNRWFTSMACAGNTCYSIGSYSNNSKSELSQYLKLSISGDSVSCWVDSESSSGSVHYYYGDLENKAYIVQDGFESFMNGSRLSYSIINLGSGNYAYKQISYSGSSNSTAQTAINVQINGVNYTTTEKYSAVGLCRMGSNRFVAYSGNLYFYEFNASTQKLDLKYTKSVSSGAGYSTPSIPFGDGACLIGTGTTATLVKW